MGKTIYDQAVSEAVLECLQSEMAATLTDYWVKLKKGFFDRRYVDYFLQKGGWMNEGYTFDDAYAFMGLHTHLCLGHLLACDLHIGSTPSSDASVARNLEKLRDGLSGIVTLRSGIAKPAFDVDLWGGTQDEDGMLSWSPYLHFDSFKEGKPDKLIKINGRHVSLEVGSQSGAKTIMQLMDQRALARWPYGSSTIRIFYVQEPWWDDLPIVDFGTDHQASQLASNQGC